VSVISYCAVTFLKPAFGYDDSLDVFGVHALGGAWGALASGIFADDARGGQRDERAQIMVQLQGIVFVIVFAPIATAVILLLLKAIFGSLRVSDETESQRAGPRRAQRERLWIRGRQRVRGRVGPRLACDEHGAARASRVSARAEPGGAGRRAPALE
jgi:hypothetical protein